MTLSTEDMELIDRCVDALIRGDTEIDIGGPGVLTQFSRLDPDDVDAYAARRLPTASWGTQLRLTWQTWRTGSSALTFEPPPRLCRHCDRPIRATCLPPTGWTHGVRRGHWEGVRCPGGITGAEPKVESAAPDADVTI